MQSETGYDGHHRSFSNIGPARFEHRQTRTPRSTGTAKITLNRVSRCIIGTLALASCFGQNCSVVNVEDATVEDQEVLGFYPDLPTTNSDGSATNSPPTADAGWEISVIEGEEVTLYGAGSRDPDGDTLTYSWVQKTGPTVSLTGADSAIATFIAPQVDIITTLWFTLTVNDGEFGSTDTVTVQVLDSLDAASAIPELMIAESTSEDSLLVDLAAATVSGEDLPEGFYFWDLNDGTPNISGTEVSHTYSSAGTYSITLTFCVVSTFGLPGGCTETTKDVSVPKATTGGGGDSPVIAFEQASSVGNEGSSRQVRVVMSEPWTTAVSVDYEITDDTATTDDHTFAGGILTFEPGETSKSFTVATLDDALVEGDESFEIKLASTSQGVIGTPFVHTCVIIDNEDLPGVQFDASSSSGDESVSSVNMAVSLNSTCDAEVSVDYRVTAGNAVSPADYTLVAGTLTFQPGEIHKIIRMTIAEDSIDESDETITVTLSDPVRATLATRTSHTYTIIDNDTTLPVVQFTTSSSNSVEQSTTVDVALSLNQASTDPVTVDFSLGGSATQGTDYTCSPASRQVTFEAGQTNGQITLTIINDNQEENTETVSLTLSNPNGATIGSRGTHTHSITDDDRPGTTYYVSKTGSDSNNGLTTGTPFKTISKAAGLVNPGDTVEVMAGTYYETVQVRRIGSADARIVFRPYAGANVVIDGQNTRRWCIILGDGVGYGMGSYITVDGFELINATEDGMHCRHANGSILRNLHIHDNGGSGIRIQGQCEGSIVEDCHMHNNNIQGVRIVADGGSRPGSASNITVRRCYIHDHSGIPEGSDGITLGACDGGEIAYNICFRNYDDGIDVPEGSLDVRVHHNIVFNNDPFDDPDGDGNGIKVSTKGGGNHTVDHNIVFANTRAGFDEDIYTTAPGNFFYNNIGWNNGAAGLGLDTGDGGVNVASVVKNNIFGNNGSGVPKYAGSPDYDTAGDHAIKESDYNFIADGEFPAPEGVHSIGNASVGFVDPYIKNWSTGTISNSQGEIDVSWQGSLANTMAHVRSQIEAAFSLAPNSLCVDAGTVVSGITTSFHGDAPDIGVVESH